MRSGSQSARFWYVVAILAVLLGAVILRFFNLNWDRGTHIHPDERYLTMVVSTVRFPGEANLLLQPRREDRAVTSGIMAFRQYWDTQNSPLNPANYEQFASYVYGTLPLFATRVVARWVDRLACATHPTHVGRLLQWLLTGSVRSCIAGFYTGYSGIHLVGRCLAALADLGTLMVTVLIARLVAAGVVGNKSGMAQWMSLIAGMLYACAVLPIQHAHFFVVDSFATVFVTITLLFSVYALRTNKATWMLPAGLAAGLAVASKISVWPLGILLMLAGLWLLKDARHFFSVVITLTLAALLGAVAFRSAQPYAFTGPGFLDVSLNPQWLKTMRGIRDLMRGLQDVPYGHQWTRRAPIIFPLRNMVIWGMGLPLGIASWLGWGIVGWQLMFRKQRTAARGMRHATWLLWLWGGGFFLYQGTQWVKSMRYLLPIYPAFTVFAAWLLLEIRIRSISVRSVIQPVLRAVPVLVVLGTVAWCLIFLAIYVRPLTRIEASEWMLGHIPTAVNLRTTSGRLIPLPVPRAELSSAGASITLHLDALPHVGGLGDVALEGERIVAVELPKVGARGIEGIRRLQVALNGHQGGGSVALVAENVSQAAVLTFPDPVALRSDAAAVDLEITLLSGDPVTLDTSVIANEHWDDPLPLRLDGWDPFSNWYRGLESSSSGQMNNYDNDTLEKRRQLLNWLDEADYIVLSSNRLYASIPRLAMRYPLTTAYYQSLFDGSLGFELEAEFVSYPRFGPCQFPDQEMPFPLPAPRFTTAYPCEIQLPPAEEAFSVYDHPTVLVFKKTSDYSREKARELLPLSLLDHVRWMTPREATRLGGLDPAAKLLATPRVRAEQEAGGTWSELFNRVALQNRSERVAIVMWALMLTLLGWLAYPWLFRVFPSLRLRGYGVARTVGLLVWSYIPWVLASLHVLPHSRTLLWAVFLALLLLSVWAAYRQRERLAELLAREWRSFLVIDALFIGLYLAWVWVRWLNPDLWHPVTGGEKPMDFAYLNAVVKSTWFPPYDPWFAGGNLNYYYFGFVMIGSMVKALGIIPSMAYNLAVPSLFALTGLGAYTVASNLAGGDYRRGMRAGLWAVLLVLIAGNLGEVQLLVKGLAQVGGIQFDSLIPGYSLMVSALAGLWKVLFKGVSLPFRPEWWYWNASRIIPVRPEEVGPINEFPAFTFLYADLHAHMMAMPLVYVSLVLALQWAVGGASPPSRGRNERWDWLPRPIISLPLASLVAGALRATNTWDYPTALALMSAGCWLGSLDRLLRGKGKQTTLPSRPRSDMSFGHQLWRWIGTPLLLLLGAELAFRPYTSAYVGVYAAFDWWTGSRTPLGTYLLMYGQFLFPIAVAGVVGLTRVLGMQRALDGTGSGVTESVWRADVALLTPAQVVWRRGFLVLLAVVLSLLIIGVILIGYLRVPIAWLLVPLGTIAAALVLDSETSIRQRVLWVWVGAAVMLSLLVEIAVLRGDIGRMNTVFKFHLEVWALLGVSAAVFAERLMHSSSIGSFAERQRLEHSLKRPSVGVEGKHALPWAAVREWAWVVMVLLVVGAMLYPAFAIPWKVSDRWAPQAPHTLDGMAYMAYALQYENDHAIPLVADYHVIQWLQDHVPGSPTVIEAQASREYLWGNRISIYTGLPSVVGWRWHQVQQRMALPAGTVEGRQHDVRFFYDTSDPYSAREILERYHVQYVILTPYERAYMLPQGLPKFDTMVAQGWLRVVYQDEWSTVYQVRY